MNNIKYLVGYVLPLIVLIAAVVGVHYVMQTASPSADDVQKIAQSVAAKYNIPTKDFTLSPIKRFGATYQLTVNFVVPDESGMTGSTLAYVQKDPSGAFAFLYDVQGVEDCDTLVKYHVPVQLEDSCTFSGPVSMVGNPNGNAWW